MRGSAWVIAVVLLCASPVAAGRLERIEAAKDADRVAKLAKRYERRIRRGYDDYCITRELALAYARYEKVDEAVAVLDRHRSKFTEGQQDLLLATKVEILARAGRLDEAITAGGDRLEEAANDKTAWLASQQLATVYEQKGDWKKALEHYCHPHPRYKCGKCRDGLEDRFAINVARCHFHLGKVRQALDQLGALMSRPRPHGIAGQLYCEYAARSGRLEEARKRIARLQADAHRVLHYYLAIAEGFAAKDPGRILATLEKPENRLAFHPAWPASLLVELGPPGIAVLAERISAGSEVAVLVARKSGRSDLVPALRARLETTEDRRDRNLLESALEELGAGAEK